MTSDASRTRALNIGILFGIAAFTLAMTIAMRHVVNDDAYITFRYAQNLALGRGFVFNPGEVVLGTTAPLYGLLLGAIAKAYADVPLDAFLLSYVACVTLSYCVYLFLSAMNLRWGGILAAALIASSATTYAHFPLETILVAALVALSLVLMQRRQFDALALTLAAAVLVRADSFLWVVVLCAYVAGANATFNLSRRTLVRALVLFFVPVASWMLYAKFHYGEFFSNSAATKSGWQGHARVFVGSLWDRGLVNTLARPWLSVGAIPFVVAGAVTAFRRAECRLSQTLVCYWFLYTAAYSALRIFWPHTWYYYPLHVVHCVLFAIGFERGARALQARFSMSARVSGFAAGAIAGVLVALGAAGVLSQAESIPRKFSDGGRDSLYRAAASWLREHPDRCGRLASVEVGTLAYYSDRPFVDRMGLVTPAAGAEMKRTNDREIGIAYTNQVFRPDCFVLTAPIRRWPDHLPEANEYALAQVFRDAPSRSELALYAR